MIDCPKGSLYPVMFGVVVALASILVVTAGSQYSLASITIAGGDGGGGMADLDVEEAAEAENTSMVDAANQTTTNGNMTDVQFLFIQRAQSGSLNEINATAYSLELNNVANETILFSDRPERIVESVSTSDFVGNWTAGQDSFESDAPNTALIVEDVQTGELETAIIELFDPVYDANTNALTYAITGENRTAVDLPGEFGQSIFVIDGSGIKWFSSFFRTLCSG